MISGIPFYRQCRSLFRGENQTAWRALVAFGMLGILVGTAFLLSSCASPKRTVHMPLEIPGATAVGNKVCADCHAAITHQFPGSLHARVHLDTAKLPGGTSCESCHGPGSKHVAAGGGRGRFILNPGKEAAACLQCHQETHAELSLPHHHPVLEQKMNCVQCHSPHGPDPFRGKGAGLAMARNNEACASCHREQTRPVIFEHEALREGCAVCHNPHGSINPKMLVQRDANLCLKCHAQTPGPGGQLFIGSTPHAQFLQRGTCWTSGCHTAVHGSNIDSFLRY